MTCPRCHQPVPDDLLCCPLCPEKTFLPTLLAAGQMTLTRGSSFQRWHLQLASIQYTWCGRPAQSRWKKQRIRIRELPTYAVCDQCQATFDRLREEIAQAEEA